MLEILNFIFSTFFTWAGTVILVHALSSSVMSIIAGLIAAARK